MTDSLIRLGLATWAAHVATILLIALVALFGWLLLRYGAERVARSLVTRRPQEDETVLSQVELERRVRTLQELAVRSAGSGIVVVAVLMALSELGLDIGPAIAGLGIAGIAVGLGAQSLVKDWLAGIFIVLENQYSRGDVVRIAGVSGAVEEFSLRRTTLRDLDGAVHTVPNGQIVVASNLTRTWARVNLDVPVAYGTDIDMAASVIDGIGKEMLDDPEWGPRLLEAPSVVRVGALGDLGVSLKVLGQVRAAEQWSVAGELRKRILSAFAARRIEIPTGRIAMGSAGPPPGATPPDAPPA